mmetsp:Transcript_35460/g.60783  ORF Transcript_35460/g.60783 Transcript_35460/m.60783 type:complete len:134 (+) Transcript_35460:72-473(+)
MNSLSCVFLLSFIILISSVQGLDKIPFKQFQRALLDDPAGNYTSDYYNAAPPPDDNNSHIWQSPWFWIIVGIVLILIVFLVGAIVVKQCLCEKKRKLKYNKLDVESRYGSSTPITDQHRADMEAKYGKLSRDY